jgi:hypothetical protein
MAQFHAGSNVKDPARKVDHSSAAVIAAFARGADDALLLLSTTREIRVRGFLG